MEELSANQRYKKANTTLSFADWLEREKAKGEIIKNTVLENVVSPYQESNKTQKKNEEPLGFGTGIPTKVLAIGVAIIIGAIIYKKYK